MGAACLKPDGGFCFIPVMAILATWRAYKAGIIRLLDLRVWLACFELKARRCGLGKGRVPRYTLEELHELVGGVGGEHLRQSLNRLAKQGMLHWSESSLIVSESTLDTEGDEADRMTELVVNVRRRVPIPRRILRYVAAQRRPVLLATVFGHLLRCVYYRRTGIRTRGLVKASWIAELFGVDERNVKAARALLADSGMVTLGSSSQFVLNRWGLPTEVNMCWEECAASRSSRRTPPRRRESTTTTPPPRRTGNSSRDENVKLRPKALDGVRKRTVGHIAPGELRHASGVERIWRRAVDAELCGRSEADRLRIFAAAVHACRVATRNAAGLLATIITNSTWHHVSNADEDVGRRMLRTVGTTAPVTRSTRTEGRSPCHRQSAPSAESLDRAQIRELIRQSFASVGEHG